MEIRGHPNEIATFVRELQRWPVDKIELRINGDAIYPDFLEAIRGTPPEEKADTQQQI